MIYCKTEEEIEFIRQSADILGRVHGEMNKIIRPGITTKFLDDIAYQFIMDSGALPSFKGYRGFPATLCISVNDEVVHGIPGSRILQDGDIASVDCGVFYKGLHSDSAYTYSVGIVSNEVKQLLDVTKGSLYKGIDQIKSGNRIGDLSFAIQSHVEKYGYSVVRELVGHGVGRKLHEEPEVPNFGKRGAGPKMIEGMVIAIEPMINLGRKGVQQDSDGWTIRTSDRKPSAHFEHTVLVTKKGSEILTTFKYIDSN